eukprot:11175207-Alexandrium_andersonii.AAC.1
MHDGAPTQPAAPRVTIPPTSPPPASMGYVSQAVQALGAGYTPPILPPLPHVRPHDEFGAHAFMGWPGAAAGGAWRSFSPDANPGFSVGVSDAAS